MIIIKKLLIAIPILALLMFVGAKFLLVAARNDPSEKNPTAVYNSQKNREVSSTELEDEEEEETPEPEESPEPEPTRGASASVRLQNAIRKMERLQERINDPEVGEQVQETTQTQAETNLQIQEKLQAMEGRPGLLKLIMGPDYKNAGQVRSAIVRLQNQERQMLKIRERLTQPEDISTIDEAIQTVQTSVSSYQQMLSEKLAGFSLFGWLARLLSGYTPPEPSPSPSILPSESPEATTAPSPEASSEPTIAPSVTPEPTATPV